MKKARQPLKYQLPILFLGILFLPLLNSLFGFWTFDRKEENRNIRNAMGLYLSNLKNIPNDCESYWNDNFPFRSPLLDIFHRFKYHYFNISPHPDKTIIGSNDWYFMAFKEMAIYKGEHDFSNNTIQSFEREWRHRINYLDSMDIKMYWVVAPIKHHVYADKLPLNIIPGDKRRIVQLMDTFSDTINDRIIDPVPEMIKIKENTKLYYKLDNHWNLRSGQLTTEMLISKIKADFPKHTFIDPPNYQWSDSISQIGFHRTVMGIDELSESRQFPLIEQYSSQEIEKYGFQNISGFPYPWEYERRFENTSIKDGLRVLFIRDSFGEQMMPFVREYFKETVFIFDAWQYKLNKTIIEKVQPDIVVFEGLESNLEHILDFSDLHH